MLLIAGWGMGDKQGGMPRELAEAIAILQRERIPVIALNTGLGGELSAGLAVAAGATGGTYAGAVSVLPAQVLERFRGALDGHWELLLRTEEEVPAGEHRLTVAVSRKGVEVLAPASVIVTARPAREVEVPDTVPGPGESALEIYRAAMRTLQDGTAEGVEEQLSRAIEQDPTLADAWYQRAMLALERGDTAAARRDLTRYLDLAPGGQYAVDARAFLASLER